MQSLLQTAATWFGTPLGRYLLTREQAYIDTVVPDIFGFNSLQLGLGECDYLRSSRISLRCRIGLEGNVGLKSSFEELPIATASIDLVILPHTLEFAHNPHQILREVDRVLMPEGQVVVSCFNPWSLWGMQRAFSSSSSYPWTGEFINLHRLKDWLALLGFEIKSGKMCCYVPPFSGEVWLRRFAFMEKMGDRWWPFSGAVYFLHAIKRVRGMRLITPDWASATARQKRLAVAPQKVTDKETWEVHE